MINGMGKGEEKRKKGKREKKMRRGGRWKKRKVKGDDQGDGKKGKRKRAKNTKYSLRSAFHQPTVG